MARRRAGPLACALAALALVGCETLRARFAHEMASRTIALTFDRPSDLLPPEGLRITSSAGREVALAWDPVLVGDVAGYVVMRSDRESEAFAPVGRTYSRFDTVYIDHGEVPGSLDDGQTYYYRIHPHDGKGRVSRSHAFAKATTEPAPDKPDSPQVYSNLPRRVVLSWTPATRPSVAGYAVLRSPTAAGPWERVTFVEGRLRTIFEDAVPGDLRVMYYRLQAVNGFGGESEMSEPVRAVTKAEPLPPLVPTVAGRDLGTIALRWPRNVEPDVVYYEVMRSERSDDGWGTELAIAQVTPPATQAFDPAVGCGQPVRYRLRAADADGLLSGYSDALETVGQDIGLAVDDSGGRLRLRWDPQRTRGWEHARIYERRSLRPDRLLGEVQGASEFALAELGSGSHRLSVILETSSDNADARTHDVAAGPTRLAPECEIVVRVP